MVRWSLMLAVALGVLAIAIGIVLLSVSVNDTSAESVRQSRVLHQQLQQQLSLIRSPDHEQQINDLAQPLDALQITIVEAVSQLPMPAGVLDLAYEQQILPPMLSTGTTIPVTTLRLSLLLTLDHSMGLVNMLTRLIETVPSWPFEVRGCEIQRMARRQLNSHCIVDFYHWTDSDAQPHSPVTDRDGSMRDES